ncbi:host specificity factor TipJ family phage tail protein [Methylobacterium flocculans]|uniref:host specificity factor TipJ family phage tail protein n=1 Tax=Methylobacterium flocculans TaxID=2984843 RepID=UPI0021F2C4A1|nr:host specificity factor TipJ family phage tail protein [Methylobacterium sp. FF17]
MTALIPGPLHGELLGPGDTVAVIAALHPLSPSREIRHLPAGLSLTEIVAIATAGGRYRHGSLRVSLGADQVPADLWPRVRVKAGATVVLRAVPRGGGGGLFKSLAMLAVAVLTAFVAPYLTPILGTFGTAVVTAAITVGAGLLLNALFPVNTKKNGGNVYSIGGNQNLATKYQPFPSVLGRMRTYPRYGGSAYTEFDGDDQYVRLLYVWGYGALDIADLKIAETPISAYHDVQIQTYYGYPTDPKPTLYATTVVQQDLNIEIKNVDGWTTRTTSEDVTEWALDIVCPNGLSATRNSGKTTEQTVSIEIQRSVAYANDFVAVETLTMTANSTKPIRRTVRRPEAVGTYDIRWRRVTRDFDGDAQVNATSTVTALRSYRPGDPLTFRKPLAITALRIRATSQLSGIVDNLNGIVTSRVKAFDGTSWVADVPSRNPGDLYPWVLQGPANAKPRVDAKIDWPAIQRFRENCRVKGYTYDLVHEEQKSILATCQDILSAGRGVVVFHDGKWSVAFDEPDALIVQHFTPRNSWGFSGKRTYKRLPHAFRVKFRNEARGYREDEILVFADGYDASNATLFEEVEFPGQTNHKNVWRLGRYHYAQLLLRPEEYRLSADIEQLISTRGDRVRVLHDVPKWGIVAARVVAVSGNLVHVDERVPMAAGRSYCVRFRLADGSSGVRLIQTVAGEVDAVTLTGGDIVPAAGDLCMFGEVGQETVVLRVKEIVPGEDLSAELTLVDDAPEIALADQGVVPDPVGGGNGDTSQTLRPINLRVVEGNAGADAGYAPTVTLLWDTPSGVSPIRRFEVALKGPSDSAYGAPIEVTPTLRSYTWQSLPPGETSFQVRSLFEDGSYSGFATTSQAVVSWSAAPPAVTGLRVTVVGGLAIFSWDGPRRVVAQLELRYSPATSGVTWESATPVGSRANGTTMSVPFAAGTYLAKFLNGGGTYSQAPTTLVVTAASAADARVGGEIFDMEPFTGVHVGTIEADGGVRLAPDAGGVVGDGTYTPADVIDLGAIYVSRISGDLIAHGLDTRDGSSGAPDIYGVDEFAWGAVLELRSTRDDPASPAATWTEWSTFSAGDVTARGFAVRARLSSDSQGITPVVELIHLRADIEARTDAVAALAIPTSGRRVEFRPAFQSRPAIAVTGRDFATGDVLDWGATDGTGFTLTVRNRDGNSVARTIDFIASGYGRRLS